MAVEVRVPVLGESVLEATVGKWLKSEGEPVAVGDLLPARDAMGCSFACSCRRGRGPRRFLRHG